MLKFPRLEISFWTRAKNNCRWPRPSSSFPIPLLFSQARYFCSFVFASHRNSLSAKHLFSCQVCGIFRGIINSRYCPVNFHLWKILPGHGGKFKVMSKLSQNKNRVRINVSLIGCNFCNTSSS